MTLMLAFWLGTIPVLSGLASLWHRLRPRHHLHLNWVTAAMLIGFGCMTVFFRSHQEMQNWVVERTHNVSSLLEQRAEAASPIRARSFDLQGIDNKLTEEGTPPPAKPNLTESLLQSSLKQPLPCCQSDTTGSSKP